MDNLEPRYFSATLCFRLPGPVLFINNNSHPRLSVSRYYSSEPLTFTTYERRAGFRKSVTNPRESSVLPSLLNDFFTTSARKLHFSRLFVTLAVVPSGNERNSTTRGWTRVQHVAATTATGTISFVDDTLRYQALSLILVIVLFC